MIITCERCSTKYRFDETVTDAPAFKVRCSKCKHRFTVYKPEQEQTALLLEETIDPDQHRIIAISNQKGGVAKTSTCLNLGAALALLNKRVLLIDFDVQANLTILLKLRKTRSFYEILQSGTMDLSGFIERTPYKNLHLLPSNSRMALLKKSYFNLHNFEYLLRDRLKSILDSYDHILIDTPPSIEFFTLNALMTANTTIIPTTCEYLSMHGIHQIKDILSVIEEKTEREIRYHVLVTMYNAQKTSEKVIYDKLKKEHDDLLFKTAIELDDKMTESHILNMPLIHYDKTSKAALQYMALARELVEE